MKKYLVLGIVTLFLTACGKKTALQDYEQHGLRVEIPYEMQKVDAPVPEHSKAVLDQVEIWQYENRPDWVSLSLVFRQYKPELGGLNLQNLAAETLANIQYLAKGRQVNKMETGIGRDGVPGVEMLGTFEVEDGQIVAFRSMIFAREQQMWQLFCLYKEGDRKQEEILQSIFESVSFQ